MGNTDRTLDRLASASLWMLGLSVALFVLALAGVIAFVAIMVLG